MAVWGSVQLYIEAAWGLGGPPGQLESDLPRGRVGCYARLGRDMMAVPRTPGEFDGWLLWAD